MGPQQGVGSAQCNSHGRQAQETSGPSGLPLLLQNLLPNTREHGEEEICKPDSGSRPQRPVLLLCAMQRGHIIEAYVTFATACMCSCCLDYNHPMPPKASQTLQA